MSEMAQTQAGLQDIGAELGCPPGVRTLDYLRVRVKQALKADSAIEALSMIADGETSDPVSFAKQALLALSPSTVVPGERK